MKFIYISQKNKNGIYTRGIVESESIKEAEKSLLSRNVPVLDISPVREKIQGLSKELKKESTPKISLGEKMAFAEQMQQCQTIEMNLRTALGVCAEMSATKKFADVCLKMRASVDDGESLHEAMKKTGIFEPLVLGLVNAGEKSGFLDKAFEQIKDNYRRAADIRRRIIKLAAYPIVVLFVAAICIFFLMWKTVPTFIGLFASAGMELPLPTKILIAISGFTTKYPHFIALGILAFGFFMVRIPYFYRKAIWTHDVILKTPIIGPLQKLLIQEVFTRTLSNLFSAGLRVIDALQLCRQVSSCFPYKGAIARAILDVSAGESLMKSLEPEKDIFGILVIRSLGFGEKVGKTEVILEPLSKSIGNKIVDKIDTLNVILEPILTLFIGAIVLLILLALFIPIFTLPKLI